MGAYYGGTAFSNNQPQIIANTVINEAQQLLSASRMWASNTGQSDVSSGAAANGSISSLVNNKYLSNWPSLMGPYGGLQFTYGTGTFSAGPAPITGNVTTGAYDYGCYNLMVILAGRLALYLDIMAAIMLSTSLDMCHRQHLPQPVVTEPQVFGLIIPVQHKTMPIRTPLCWWPLRLITSLGLIKV